MSSFYSLHRSSQVSSFNSPTDSLQPSSVSTQSISPSPTQLSFTTTPLSQYSSTKTSSSTSSSNVQRRFTADQARAKVNYTHTLTRRINLAELEALDIGNSSSEEDIPLSNVTRVRSSLQTSRPAAVQEEQEQKGQEGDRAGEEEEEDYLLLSEDEEPTNHIQDLSMEDELEDMDDLLEDTEEDDGEELARLLLQAEQRRNNTAQPEEHMPSNQITLTEMRSDRRQQALAYLASIPLSFLSEVDTSLRVLNYREQNDKTSKSKTKKKASSRKRKQSADTTDDEKEDSQDPAKIVVEGEVGIEMRLKNRKNDVDQVTSFPDDPVTFETSGKELALHRMACTIRVASLLYEAILTNIVTTKRDIYYKDVALFNTQSVVDKLVDDIAASAGLKRQDFHVCATSKGLIASCALRVYLRSGEELVFSATNPSLIPPIERIDRVETVEPINWVLIVEKDAVFQTLCAARLVEHETLGNGVIITGKGYPDLATLQLLHLIAETFPSIPFYALVDADPHGLDILSVYTRGSKATKFSKDHEDLALGDRLEWLGVKGSELVKCGVKHDELLQLSERDVQKAMSMLRDRRDMPAAWKRELCHMLHTNRKAEIQILSSGSTLANSQTDQALDRIFSDDAEVRDVGDRGSHVPGAGGGLVDYIVQRMM